MRQAPQRQGHSSARTSRSLKTSKGTETRRSTRPRDDTRVKALNVKCVPKMSNSSTYWTLDPAVNTICMQHRRAKGQKFVFVLFGIQAHAQLGRKPLDLRD